MSTDIKLPKITLNTFYKHKKNATKFSAITAYDASFAKMSYDAKIDLILVGDSLGMTIQGNKDTTCVSTDDIAYHTKCVKAGAPDAYIMADMPFMSYIDVKTCLLNAKKLIQAGANIIKIEGTKEHINHVKSLNSNGIPVCMHLGLTPQFINILGSYKVQGKSDVDANILKENIYKLDEANTNMFLLECVPESLATEITTNVKAPVIGIGAGKNVNGQILVNYDILGITQKKLRFAKNFMENKNTIQEALNSFNNEVKEGKFPLKEHSF